MSVTIGLVANVYQEANALPGWLETHLPFFDDVRVLHAGPGGAYSNDGTLEILDKWSVPVEFCAIDDGFGVVRTRALRMSSCDYVMLLDADERFYPVHRVLQCEGEGTTQHEVDRILQGYDFRGGNLPNWDNLDRLGASLKVWHKEGFCQGVHIRDILDHWEDYTDKRIDAVATIRRHWHDFSFQRPTQNWQTNPDWQLRLVRNTPGICFDPGTRMHESLYGAKHVFKADMLRGPFFDHFHFTFKRMEVEQRAHDVAIYDAVHAGGRPPLWEEFKKTV